jgi:hypothetical protein
MDFVHDWLRFRPFCICRDQLMSEETIKALEERMAAMDKDMQAMFKAVTIAVSLLARNDPKKLQFAERLRTLGDRPGLDSTAARELLDAIADRVETAGS